MAGGMSRGGGVPLSERVKDREPPDQRVARHCWVRDHRYTQKLPGLLLRWEQTGQSWHGLVVYAIPERDGLVQRWVEQFDLTPSDE